LVPCVAPCRYLTDEDETEEHAEANWDSSRYGSHTLLPLRTQAQVVHHHGPGIWPRARGVCP
jgi:hypothetical protein